MTHNMQLNDKIQKGKCVQSCVLDMKQQNTPGLSRLLMSPSWACSKWSGDETGQRDQGRREGLGEGVTCQQMPCSCVWCSSASTTTISPRRAAMYKGASPAELRSKTSAPACSSSLAQVAWPDSQATKRGVAPPLSLAFTPLPSCSRPYATIQGCVKMGLQQRIE